MICSMCADLADNGLLGEVHIKTCEGPTRCDCQHKQGIVNDKEKQQAGESPKAS